MANFFRISEELVYYLFILLIPLQTRKILWQSNIWTFNEWQAIFVYVTDILFFVLLIFSFAYKKSWSLKLGKSDRFLAGFFIISTISLFNTSSLVVSSFQLLKLAELIALYYYLKNYALPKFGLFHSALFFVSGGLMQAVLAIAQYIVQADLGLRLFGESILHARVPGVAWFTNSDGQAVMRAYGTFPHPNVLAGFLAVTIFALLGIYIKITTNRIRNAGFIIAYWILLAGLFFTFSRTTFAFMAAAFIIVFGGIFLKGESRELLRIDKEFRKKILVIIWASVIAISFFIIFFMPEISGRLAITQENDAVQMRIEYGRQAVNGGLRFLGVGIGDFIGSYMKNEPYLPYYLYQPVHNIYLLIYSETGVFGISAFVLFLWFLFADFWKKNFGLNRIYIFSIIFMILGIGLFDHYSWTLQQGRLVFWSLLALAVGSKS